MASKPEEPSTTLTAGDKCAAKCERIGQVCKVIGLVNPCCGQFALTSVKIGKTGSCKMFKKVPNCIGDAYTQFFVSHGPKPFIVQDEKQYTYQKTMEVYGAVGAWLRGGQGVKIGESVGMCMRNMPEFMLGFLAATSVGCRAVPLNSLWGAEELEYSVKDSDCKVIFCDQQRCDLLKPFASKLGCKLVLCGEGDAGADAVQWDQVVADGAKMQKPSIKDVKMDDDAMIMYTSGSTGFPKGVVHSQRSLGTALIMQHLFSFLLPPDPEGKTLLTAPLFHITALINIFLNALACGIQLHMLYKWDGGKALDIIDRHKITRFTGVPTMIRDILEHPDFRPERIASLKTVVGGGSAVPPSLMAKINKGKKGSGAQGYGLTETCGGVVINKGFDAIANPKSAGKPIPLFVEVVAKDPDSGKTLADGQRGEICIRTALNMVRYHNRPEDTAKVLDDEGFFHTGDVGRIEAGFVYIVDRLKDLINRGGEKVDSQEVEQVLYSHPAMRECSVFGLPHKRLGSVVGCAVWLQENVTAEQIVEFLLASGKLAKFKIPEANCIFIHNEELPKGATGKIDKKGMRETYSKMIKEKEGGSFASFA